MRDGLVVASAHVLAAVLMAVAFTIAMPAAAHAQSTTFIPSNIPTLLCTGYHDFKTIAGPLGLAVVAFTFVMGMWAHDPHFMRHIVRAVGFALGVYALAQILGAAGLNTYCS